MFSWEIFEISEAVTGGVLWKKLFLKNSQYSEESCWPATLLKRDSNTAVFLWIFPNFYEHYFEEHLLAAASDLKQL